MSEERERKGMPVWGWVLIVLGALVVLVVLGGTCCVGGGGFLRGFLKAKAQVEMVAPLIKIEAHMAGLQKKGYTVKRTEVVESGKEKERHRQEKRYLVTSPEGEETEYIFGFDIRREESKEAGPAEMLGKMVYRPMNEPARRLWEELGLLEEEGEDGEGD
jgi:hypothetical protein